MNNCFHSIQKIHELLKIPYTEGYLKKEILSHPNFPSLLTISDVMEKYEIGNVPLKIGRDKLDDIPLPCVVQVSIHGREFFQVITGITDQGICQSLPHEWRTGSPGRKTSGHERMV